jgi:hypothetical protein
MIERKNDINNNYFNGCPPNLAHSLEPNDPKTNLVPYNRHPALLHSRNINNKTKQFLMRKDFKIH